MSEGITTKMATAHPNVTDLNTEITEIITTMTDDHHTSTGHTTTGHLGLDTQILFAF